MGFCAQGQMRSSKGYWERCTYARRDLRQVVLDEPLQHRRDRFCGATELPAILRLHIHERTGEEYREHVVDFVLREQTLRIRLCLRRDPYLRTLSANARR